MILQSGHQGPQSMDCPLTLVHRVRKAILKPPAKKPPVNVQGLKEDIRKYFWHLATHYCQDSNNITRQVKCACWIGARRWLDDEDIDALVKYLFDYAMLEAKEQKARLADWMRYAQAMQKKLYNVTRTQRRQLFLIPGFNRPEAMADLQLCTVRYAWHDKEFMESVVEEGEKWRVDCAWQHRQEEQTPLA
jgi:hypothetical protein